MQDEEEGHARMRNGMKGEGKWNEGAGLVRPKGTMQNAGGLMNKDERRGRMRNTQVRWGMGICGHHKYNSTPHIGHEPVIVEQKRGAN